MPACRQCGKDNPEGTAYCGYCATPLARPGDNPTSSQPKPSGNPISSPPMGGSSPQPKPSPAPKPSRPEIRTPVFHTSAPPPSDSKGQRGFEWIPWSELSSGQRLGRSIAIIVALFLLFFSARGILRSILAGRAASGSAPSAEGSDAPITQGDRKDGIESLCKVFQIYGLPGNDHDAAEAARNAAELFKLAGNQSPERSRYILTSIVQEFRGGKLSSTDCAEAGAPLATTEQSSDNSTPAIQR